MVSNFIISNTKRQYFNNLNCSEQIPIKTMSIAFSWIGITDHTNILPASLISPMGTENSNYDYSIFDRADVDTENLLDVWADEMK